MPEKTLNEVFSEIADAIREKSESSKTIKPVNMAAAIEEIPTGPQFHNTLVAFSDGDKYCSLEPYNPSFLVSKSAAEYSGNSSDVEIVGDYEGAGVYYYSTSTSPGQLRILDGDYFDSTGHVLDFDEGAFYYYQGDSGGLEVDEPIYFDDSEWYQYESPANFTLIGNRPHDDGLYKWDATSHRFVRDKLADGLYQILNSSESNISLATNDYYQYTIDGDGRMEFMPYTPGPTPEKGKYYYGNALTAQNLVTNEYYSYIGSDSELYANHFENNCLYYMGSDLVKLDAYDNVDHYYYINGVNASKLTGLNGSGYYQFDGNIAFTPYTPSGSGQAGSYYYNDDGTITEQQLTTNHMFFSTGNTNQLAEVSTTAAEWDGYENLLAMNIDRSAAEGESGYAYYDGIYSYTLNSSGWTVDLVKLKLTAGSAYTWNGHSLIPYSETDALDMLMQETF